MWFGERDLTGLPTHKVIAAGIACIPEGRKVFPKLTVEENLRVGGYQETSEDLIQVRLAEAYALFPQLKERRAQLAGTMSGGEQAMVSIGRGLMSAPKLLLVDEPSLGLSPIYVKQNFEIIQRIRERGVTVFLVEQNARQTSRSPIAVTCSPRAAWSPPARRPSCAAPRSERSLFRVGYSGFRPKHLRPGM